MFWGLKISPGKRLSQKVSRGFHVSMAAVEKNPEVPGTVGHVQVILQKHTEFVLCTLGPDKPQQELDLNFCTGETVQFFTKGEEEVHLTGYVLAEEGDFSEYMTPWHANMGRLSLMSHEEEGDIEGELLHDPPAEPPEEFNSDNESHENSDNDSDSCRKAMETKDKGKSPASSYRDLKTAPTKRASSVDYSSEPSCPWRKKMKKERGVETEDSKPAEAEASASGDAPSGDLTTKKKKKKKKKNKQANAGQQQQNSAEMPAELSSPEPSQVVGKKRTLSGGTSVEDIKIGHGPEAKPGSTVSVYYVGTLVKNNKRFDSCLKGKPLRFRLGRGEVIKGWDTALIGMKVGGKRKITVPSSQAYGNTRQGPIPPGSTLMFDVEMKAVH